MRSLLHDSQFVIHSPYLWLTEQAPSTDTMHGPTGLSGVQAEPNNGHSAGLMCPRITLPHMQSDRRRSVLGGEGLPSHPGNAPAQCLGLASVEG
jgi:hypothetical protein